MVKLLTVIIIDNKGRNNSDGYSSVNIIITN